MTAIANTGALRPNTALSMRKPSQAAHAYLFPEVGNLTYIPTPNGVLVTCEHLLVAWIYKGYAGSKNNPKSCQFYDVAFPAISTNPQDQITGVVLDSDSFDTLQEAVQFVESAFGGAA